MKRLAIILLVALYAIGITGVNMAVHYCGSMVSSVSLGTKGKKCCCKDDKEDKCCTTKILSSKVTDNHQPGQKPIVAKPKTSTIINNTLLGINPPRVTVQPKKYNYGKWIPPPLGNPLYLRNRNILI